MDKPQVSKAKIQQTIDLEELTGMDLSANRALREVIGQDLIDLIEKRTSDGIGFNGVKLKSPYSKEYTKSLPFRAAGKSPSQINMKLTGDMLAALDVEAGQDSTIKLFIEPDQVPKSFNHLTGDTVPRRNWFGVSKKEVSEVLSQYADDLDRLAIEQADAETTSTLKAIDFVRDTFNPFNDDEGGD